MKSTLFKAISIETVGVCNRRCSFCKFGSSSKKDDRLKTKMRWSLVTSIIDQLSELEFSGRVSWQRINEPLLDSRIFEIVSLTRKKVARSHIAMVTNGDYLNQNVCDQLFGFGLSHLTVTAYCPEVLKKVSEIKAPSINIKNRSGNLNYEWDNRGGNLNMVKIRRPLGDCLRPSTMLNIVATGEALLCCCDLYGDVVVGDVREEKLAKIWHSQLLQHYRKTLAEKGRAGLKLCEACSFPGHAHGIHGNRPVE